ncbi:hypothetical protein SELMODRAFT_418304 [Selaginella moellendorffii]|uniref:Uncharacterized protein n=1 Tax=Selaginella moellendorffii TaxID=88036 RepID=D8S5A2_SELML|nr:hypothetical protein SELMODRAFT_418304 [Selaginella moellendorffii]
MVIKHTQGSYREAMHRAWAVEEVRLAPQLYNIDQLPGGCWSIYLASEDRAQELWAEELKMLDKAHGIPITPSGDIGVHEDIRDVNMMVRVSYPSRQVEVKFIDFDWAAVEGVGRCPYFMNKVDIKWPAGVSGGQWKRLPNLKKGAASLCEHEGTWNKPSQRIGCGSWLLAAATGMPWPGASITGYNKYALDSSTRKCNVDRHRTASGWSVREHIFRYSARITPIQQNVETWTELEQVQLEADERVAAIHASAGGNLHVFVVKLVPVWGMRKYPQKCPPNPGRPALYKMNLKDDGLKWTTISTAFMKPGQQYYATVDEDTIHAFGVNKTQMTMVQGKVVVVQSGNLRYYNEEAKQWEEFEELPGVLDQEKSWIFRLQGMRYAPVVFATKRHCHGLFRGTIDWEHKTVTWKRQRISENVKTYFIGIMAAA